MDVDEAGEGEGAQLASAGVAVQPVSSYMVTEGLDLLARGRCLARGPVKLTLLKAVLEDAWRGAVT